MKKLEEYFCTKKVKAVGMSRQIAESLDLVRDKTGKDELGYYIKYEDGYTSWSPKVVFEAGYALSKPMPRSI